MGNFQVKKKVDPQHIIIQGLDAAGKSTLLYNLRYGEINSSYAIIGFPIETLSFKGIDITSWDISGRCAHNRPLLDYYYRTATGFVFVVNSADLEMMDEAFDQFDSYILQKEETKGRVVMILANKQDLPRALKCEELEKKFRERFPDTPDRKIFFQPCIAYTGEGIREAFDIFTTELKLNQATSNINMKSSVEGGDVAESPKENSMKLLFKKPMSFVKSVLMY
ncbi:ADP-ribosylation factor isoform X2 [Aplysia californica]|uniref:ADP-ribosylation factor isoform X2 n=1 Tax=Aplysia californica TaxID=6500 RepID=A0ABM0JXH6_APLCA|nr:ADP-ribosylation factor isoform X2 [Aplysia californica]